MSFHVKFHFCVSLNVHTIAFFPILFSWSVYCFVDLLILVLFLVTVISLSLLFYSLWVVVLMLSSMLLRPLPPSFRDTYRLSISSLGCKALCICMSYVLLSICSSPSRVYVKNCPKYLLRGTAQVLIPFVRFLLYNLVLSSFLILLIYTLF